MRFKPKRGVLFHYCSVGEGSEMRDSASLLQAEGGMLYLLVPWASYLSFYKKWEYILSNGFLESIV